RTQSTNLFSVALPSNWQQYGGQDGSVTYAPQGAYGSQGFTHGVMFAAAQAQNSRNLQNAAREVVNGLLQGGNSYLRQTGGFTRTTINGRSALATTLYGRSPLTGRDERVTLVITQLSDGNVFYMAAVAPEAEYNTYRRAFDQAMRSLQLNDRY
ncbi:MAG TPA: hypothetical protein VK422_13240, partial [Pyrinomonadaceae bacterium]|nr:hypothetical protein [Pyrinomonadaceae bacterium]